MSRISRTTWIIIAIGFLTALATLLGNIGVSALTWLSPQKALALFVLVTATSIALDLWLRHSDGSAELSSNVQQQNRLRMLERVHRKWIIEYLEDELRYDDELLSLPLRKLVAGRWDFAIHHLDASAQPIPADTCITEVYDQTKRGDLLILGDAGSGKTTLLLELARDLIERARAKESLPIPVIFSLSSWAVKQTSIAEWLIEELCTKYQVQNRIGRAWVKQHQLLLLLDGLDEVAAAHQEACIEALNDYRRNNREPMVICCRKEEYLRSTIQLEMHTIVLVQPLSFQQIDDYLQKLGGVVAGLLAAWRKSATLQQLATTPFLLKVLILTYHDLLLPELLSLVKISSTAFQQHQIFYDYIDRMLTHGRIRMKYSPQQCIAWLACLAKHIHTEFYLEQLQSDWLPRGRPQSLFEYFAVKLPAILLGGLISLLVVNLLFEQIYSIPFELVYAVIGGLIGELLSRKRIVSQTTKSPSQLWKEIWQRIINLDHLQNGVIMGLLIGLSIMLGAGERVGMRIGTSEELSFGLSFGLIGIFLSIILGNRKVIVKPTKVVGRSWRIFSHAIIHTEHLKNGLLVGLLIFLGYRLSYGLINTLHYGLADGLNYGLYAVDNSFGLGASFGLAAIFLSTILAGMEIKIQPPEIVVWSWRTFRRAIISVAHLKRSLIVGLTFAVSYGFISTLGYGLSNGLDFVLQTGLITILSYGLSGSLCYWLSIGLFNGLSSKVLDDRYRVVPNQGIWRSARNGIVFGLIGGAVSYLVYCLSVGLNVGLGIGLSAVVGLHISVIEGLRIGLGVGLREISHNGTIFLVFGLIGGAVSGLFNGGLAFIRHSILRWLLWRAGCTPFPWHYVAFLNEASDNYILRAVGGGYLFRHRLIQDYFAKLDSPTRDEKTNYRRD